MTLKLRLTQLSLLVTLLMGLILTVPMTATEQSYIGQISILTLKNPGTVLMGDCGGEDGTCG